MGARLGGRECLPLVPASLLLILICLRSTPPTRVGFFVMFLVDDAKIAASTTLDKTPIGPVSIYAIGNRMHRVCVASGGENPL
jgi:hypothetical protein